MVLKFGEYAHSFVYFLCIVFTIVVAVQIDRSLPVGAVELSKSDALYVEGFADARGISVEEATERLRWQEKAHSLDDDLRKQYPNSFGGIWIGEDDDRVKIGSVADQLNMEKLAPLLDSLQLKDAVDILEVKYNIAKLETDIEVITDKLAATKEMSKVWPFETELRTDLNKVIIKIPKQNDSLNSQQISVFGDVRKDYGDEVGTEYSEGQAVAASCNDDFCDSPLRAGVKIRGSADGYTSKYCSAGFGVMGSSGNKYILTSGHCYDDGPGFASMEDVLFPGIKKIGPAHNSPENLNMWPDNGIDGLVIDIKDEYGWDAKGWAYIRDGTGVSPYGGPSRNEAYDITASTTSGQFINERVCNSGARTGSSCGPVKAVNVSLEYDGRISYKLVRAGLCMLKGDSGGPVFREGLALGLNSAFIGPDSAPGCDTNRYYTGIHAITQEMNNNIYVY